MLLDLGALWYLLPVLLAIFTFGGGLLMRLATRVATPLRDYEYTPRVSVLLPVYNEGPHVLDTLSSIVACNWPADKLEIIAIDDASSDDSYTWMQQAAKMWPQVRASQNAKNSGKHVTLSNALAQSTGDVVVCIDSDCIFEKQVLRELVACFADPKVGAVGGNIGVTNINTNALTVCQALVYYASFQIGKMLQSVSGRVFCISGCLFALRREIFVSVEPMVRNRNWFGLHIRDGEDRAMTHLILMQGWRTIVNPHAKCWTAVPDSVNQLFSQQIRWRRSGLRDLFWTYARLPQHLEVIGLGPLLAALVPETFTLLWTVLLISSIPALGLSGALQACIHALLTFSGIFVASALLYNMTVDRLAAGSEKIKYPALAALSGAWFFADALLITLFAMFTFDVGAWGTREAQQPKAQQ